MPNNLVFNTVASELKTQIYAQNGTTVAPIQLDAKNNVLVAGTVTVQGGVSATVNAVSFTTVNITQTTSTGTLPTLTLDVSQLMNYVYYVKNNDSTNSISVRIQVAPTNVDGYFVDDLSSVTTISESSSAVIAPKYYLNWARLVYSTGGNTANLEAYINARL